MLQLLQQVKNGTGNPIKQSNHAEFMHLERLVDEGYIKATKFEPLTGGMQLFDARLTSKGESCLENKVEPFPLEQTKVNVWTIDRKLQLYTVIIAVLGVGIAAATLLQSLA